MSRVQRGLWHSIASFFLFILSSACFDVCGPSGPPEPVACAGSVDNAATVDEIRLARNAPFHLLDEGDATETVIGGQGLTMVTIRLAWRGGDAPECGKVRIRVLHPESGAELGAREADITSTEEGDWRAGSDFFFITGDNWAPYREVRVEATAFGQTTTRLLRYGGWPPPDAGWDAGMDAGSDGGIDAGPLPIPDAGSDAAILDAAPVSSDAGPAADAGT